MSNILKAMHETAQGLHQAGGLKQATMREIDALCLPKIKAYTAAQIKRIRRCNNASQAVFAAFLNVSPSTIQKWEAGQKHPNGPSLKLLSLVEQKGIEVLI